MLKLIKQGAAAAREISRTLNTEKSGDIFKAKIALALKQFLTSKLKHGQSSAKQLDFNFSFMQEALKGFVQFKEAEETLLLFGKQEEIADYQREGIEYTVVMTKKEEFDLVRDIDFIRFMAALDIKQSM